MHKGIFSIQMMLQKWESIYPVLLLEIVSEDYLEWVFGTLFDRFEILCKGRSVSTLIFKRKRLGSTRMKIEGFAMKPNVCFWNLINYSHKRVNDRMENREETNQNIKILSYDLKFIHTSEMRWQLILNENYIGFFLFLFFSTIQ